MPYGPKNTVACHVTTQCCELECFFHFLRSVKSDTENLMKSFVLLTSHLFNPYLFGIKYSEKLRFLDPNINSNPLDLIFHYMHP